MYLENGNTIGASQKLYDIASDNSLTDWISLRQLFINLIDSGKTLYDMDSLQIEMIYNLAYNSENPYAMANAQSILTLFYGIEFNFIQGNSENARYINNVDNEDSNPVIESEESGIYLGDNIPNPFNVSTIIPYHIPAYSTGRIIISKINGKVVRSFEINSENSILELNMETLNAGVYIYTLEIEGFSNIHKKMVIIK